MKMFKKMNLAVLLSSILLSSSAFAASADVPNKYKDRDALIKQYSNESTYSVGWYTGVVDFFEFRDILDRFLPMSNYLSKKIGRLVVTITDKYDVALVNDGLAGDMDIIYTSTIMGAALVEKGWRPVVGRTEDIVGVILTRIDVKMDSPEDMVGKKIIAPFGATVTYNVKYALETKKLLSKLQYAEKNVNQKQLQEIIKDKRFDGIVIRNTLAKRLMKEQPGKYKIGFAADPGNGHVLFVSKGVSEGEVGVIKNALLALTPDIPEYKEVLSGLDGYQEKDKQPFKVITFKDLERAASIKKVLANLKTQDDIDLTK